ncbi:MAG: N-acetylmuramoyl-L-alanine amidase [Gammaproteobacteria bacterium]|nr:N-acetylmuramoyl-L-alanine amidase [Gammaproteobacteria bacterium]
MCLCRKGVLSSLRSTLLAALALLLQSPAMAVEVQQMRLHSAPDHTRLVLDLSGPAEHSVFQLEDPLRLVVDLDQGRMRFDPARLNLNGTPLASVRAADRREQGLRVVLDLRRKLDPKAFSLAPVAPYGHRLVIDLYEQKSAEPERPPRQRSAKRDVVVAIDAGHGGEDPGAIGPNGLFEKDVVLAIARRVESMLKAEPGIKPVMIRTGDYYVPLIRRTQLAREHRADLFISVHADAFHHPSARGASVFTLSDRGATSETASWLAARENRADLIGGVGNVSLNDKDDVLAQVLLDLSVTASLSASLDAGERVLESLGGVARLHSRRVEQAGFRVLRSPDIPSILVETGFISNPEESRLLATRDYQQRIANAIVAGVRAHLHEQPPPDTLLAWQRDNPGSDRRYVIEKGDTLSTIARRFGVETTAVRQANNIAGDLIRVGQVIVIPAS